RHRRQARTLFQSLRAAGVLAVVRNRKTGNRVRVHEDLGDDFSLHHTLTLYLIDTLAQLDPEAPTHALDVLTLVESILENPHVILARQMDRAKDARMAEMKAEGMEYEERIAELEKIEHPKPLGDFIYATFNAYAAAHPWVGEQNIYPKSIARDMFERCASFPEYIREYNMQRQEGILLRYLSQVVRALQQSIPDIAQSPELEDITIFLRTLVTEALNDSAAATQSLLMQTRKQGDGIVELVERLSARLGDGQVQAWQALNDHRPEAMQRWVSARSAIGAIQSLVTGSENRPGRRRKTGGAVTAPRTDALYPSWLLREPLRLQAVGNSPVYQGRLKRVSGPQRLETSGWLHDGESLADADADRSTPPAMRDYFIYRSEQGALLWVFSERLNT
ncbi:MAG: DUF3516 domain-containing protein, partial [Burkholderiales bacterium]